VPPRSPTLLVTQRRAGSSRRNPQRRERIAPTRQGQLAGRVRERRQRRSALGAWAIGCLVAALVAACFTSVAQADLFGPWSAFPVSLGGLRIVATGEFTGDANLDLVVGQNNSTTMRLVPGDGHAGFGMASTLPYVDLGWRAADINGDNRPDLVAVVDGDPQHPMIAVVALADGQGGFVLQPNHDISTEGYAESWVVGDVNGDGRDDIVAARGTTLYFARSAQAGGFDATSSQTLTAAYGLAGAGDMTDDGRADLVAAGPDGEAVLVADANGSFAPGAAVKLSDFPNGARPAAFLDFDGDGRRDVAVPDYTSVCVLYGDGAGALEQPTCFATGGPATGDGQITVGDLDADGLDDLLVADIYRGSGTREIAAVLGDPARIDYLPCADVGAYCISPRALDLDGDGLPEALVGTTAAVLVAHNTAAPAAVLEPEDGLEFVISGLGASLQLTATMINTGELPLTVTGATIDGPNAGDFSIVSTDCTAAPLVAKQACSYELRFAPTAAGDRFAQLLVHSTAPGSPHTLDLTGTEFVSSTISAGRAPRPAPALPAAPPSVRPPTPLARSLTAAQLLRLLRIPRALAVSRRTQAVRIGVATNPPIRTLTATITRRALRARAARRPVILASGTVRIPYGARRTLKARLTRQGRTLLRKPGTLRATLTLVATDTVGRRVSVTRGLALRATGGTR
jgi:hypothetical protein